MRGLGAAELNLFDLFAKISLDTSEYDSGVKDVTKSGSGLASTLKKGLASAGKVAAAGIGLITTAAGAAVGGLLALEGATEEYRVAQGKLNTAFEAAGSNANMAAYAYGEFYKILGDTDTATEASQLLSKLTTDGEDIAYWTHIAAGVFGEFGDSLPIEGLIEASNETTKTAQVTGVLADALNWVGISEDAVNEKLASMSDATERADYLMNLLMDTYDGSADAFWKNNEALTASREAQTKWMDTLSKLGTTVQTVKTNLISEFLPSIASVANAFNGMLTGTEGADEQFATAVGDLVNTAVSKLPEFLSMGVQIITALASGIVQSIPTVVSAVPQIVTEIGTALSSLFPQVLDMGAQLLGQLTTGIETDLPDMVSRLPQIIEQFLTFITDSLPDILDQGAEMLNSLVNGIIDSIPVLVSNLPQIITSFTKFVADNLPKIVETGVSIIANLVVGIIKNIPAIVKALPQIIEAIVDGIGDLMGSVVEIGVDIVEGIWEGIKSMAGWIGDKVAGFFGGIVDGVKDFLGIHSPSRVFADMGKNMALGVGEGWDNTFSDIQKSITDGMDFGTVEVDFASSGLGISSAGIINSTQTTAMKGGSYTFNLMLPTGEKLASYVFSPMVDYAKANGTPILNPT